MSAVADPGRRVGDGIEYLLQRRPQAPRGLALAATAGRSGLPREGEEVLSLGLVELQRRGEGVEDGLRGAGETAALHAYVVVHGDACQHRDLLAAQPLDPAVAAVGRQSRLLGGDASPPRTEEFADLAWHVHAGIQR